MKSSETFLLNQARLQLQPSLTFQAKGCVIENVGPSFVYVAAADHFISPWRIGAAAGFPATLSPLVQLQAPAGVKLQLGSNPTLVTFVDEELEDRPGEQASGDFAGQQIVVASMVGNSINGTVVLLDTVAWAAGAYFVDWWSCDAFGTAGIGFQASLAIVRAGGGRESDLARGAGTPANEVFRPLVVPQRILMAVGDHLATVVTSGTAGLAMRGAAGVRGL